jgi:iron complex outermembrane receptor protein
LGKVELRSHKEVGLDSFNQINRKQLQQLEVNTTAQALNFISGVNSSISGDRNEQTVFVNGFDLRQVPLLLDGIPIYVPFDGYVDLGRFTTFDLAAISVQKGLSSVTAGPNALGGAINLISNKPSHKLEVSGLQGVFNNGFRSYFNIGQAYSKFYWMGSYSRYERSSYPLSKDYQGNMFEDGGKRNNSFNRDQRVNLKFGFTPNKRQEHAINYMWQRGVKGNPSYSGSDSLNPRFDKPRYWYWPFWNKTSIYYLGRSYFENLGVLNVRLFYDQFNNKLQSFDDYTLSSQTKRYAFNSTYLDHTAGAIASLKHTIKNNRITLSGQYKYDEHNEKDEDDPWRSMSDLTAFIGGEDRIKLGDRSNVLLSASYSWRQSNVAQDVLNPDGSFSSFQPNKSDAINYGINFHQALSDQLNLSAVFAKTSRFATIKDRYSYRLGTALPNPSLEAETSTNLELAIGGSIKDWQFNVSIFNSWINNSLQQVERVLFDSSSSRWLSQQQNVGRAQFYGINLDLEKRFKNGLIFKSNYSFIERESLSQENFNFTFVPKHSANIVLRYDNLKSRLNLQAILRLQGESYSTSYGTVNNGFFIADLQAEYEVSDVFSLQASAQNILDVNYSLAEGFPEPGRTLHFTLLWNWNEN